MLSTRWSPLFSCWILNQEVRLSMKLRFNIGKHKPPHGSAGKESTHSGRPGFSPWVGKIPWRRATHSSILARLTQLYLRDSLIALLVKNPPAMQETPVRFLGQKDLLGKGRLPTPVLLGFPCSSPGKESACNPGDLGLILRLGRSPGEGKGYPLQYSGLENSMYCIDHGVTKSWT